MEIWKHKLTNKSYIYISSSETKVVLITPSEGIKTFNRDEFEIVNTSMSISELLRKNILSEVQLKLYKNQIDNLLDDVIPSDIDPVDESLLPIEADSCKEVMNVTKDQFAKAVAYWITQVMLEPGNMKTIANNIGYSYSKIFKKRLLIFQYELICLFLAISETVLTDLFIDKNDLKNSIIDKVYDILYEVCFQYSKDNKNRHEWISFTQKRCEKYIDKMSPWTPESSSLVADDFMDNLTDFVNLFSARVSLTIYIQSWYQSFQNAIESYKIVSDPYENNDIDDNSDENSGSNVVPDVVSNDDRENLEVTDYICPKCGNNILFKRISIGYISECLGCKDINYEKDKEQLIQKFLSFDEFEQ